MREFILGKNLMDVTSVGKPSVSVLTLEIMRKLTLEKNHLNVMYVGKPSVEVLT